MAGTSIHLTPSSCVAHSEKYVDGELEVLRDIWRTLPKFDKTRLKLDKLEHSLEFSISWNLEITKFYITFLIFIS